jgi:hypothetical protein
MRTAPSMLERIIERRKATAPAATTKAEAKIPVEPNRDPADVALDRKIKGICKGC